MYTHISTLQCGNLSGVIILPSTHICNIYLKIYIYVQTNIHICMQREIS